MYRVGALQNAEQCADMYPGWFCRFFVSRSCADFARTHLESLPNVQLVYMDCEEDFSAIMWRYLSLHDIGIEVHAFRDADSRPFLRETAAVEEWLASGKHFHIMRDHEQHWIEILGGMWGCDAEGASQVRGLLPNPLWNSVSYVDQWWLMESVYPIASKSVLVHDPSGGLTGEDAKDYPVEAQPNWRFVGQGFNEDGSLRVPEHARRSV